MKTVVYWICFFLLGCQPTKDKTNNPDSSKAGDVTTISSSLQVISLGKPPLKSSVYFNIQVACSELLTFEVADGAISMILSAFSTDTMFFQSLIPPSGSDLLDASSVENYDKLKIRPIITSGYTGLMVPLTAQDTLIPGTWQYRICDGGGKPVDVKLSLRSGTLSKQVRLPLQLFLTGTQFSTEDVIAALQKVKEIYDKKGILIDDEQVLVRLKNEAFAVVPPDFRDAKTAEMVANGVADRVNIFFVEDFGSEAGLQLGVASGLPAPQGIKSSYNAVLIGLSAHVLTDGNGKATLARTLLGETVAHEIGHWLGLHHTTEKAADLFDPLLDTPECSLDHDTNHNKQMDPAECQSLDGTNLMFWVGSGEIEQTNLTEEQGFVLQHSPIAQ